MRAGIIISALSHALDLAAGQPMGHSVRTCVLALRIAREIGLPHGDQCDLYYASLLKDCGYSVNASTRFRVLATDDIRAKRDIKTTDWTRFAWESLQHAFSHIGPGRPYRERSYALFRMAALNQKRHVWEVTKMRGERGAAIARFIGLSSVAADGIASIDEHWDGQGNPEQLQGVAIPMLSRIMLLAQTLEVFWAIRGETAALDIAEQRSRRWFDPELVRAVRKLHKRGELWRGLGADRVFDVVLEMEPCPKVMGVDDATLDAICAAFAQIVDAKSPFTFNHSNGVANAAVAIARTLGMSRERILFVRHAALLHDLGKLSVSNSILEKPGELENAEWDFMRLHAFYTWKILQAIPGFHEISQVAACHHEKLDGTGYFRGLSGNQLSVEARILAVADVFDALSSKRPYRDGLPPETVLHILRKSAPRTLDGACVEALEKSGIAADQTFVDLFNLKQQLESY